MNFFNLIKFRKLFFLLISFSLVYFIQKFFYFSKTLKSSTDFREQQKVEIKSEQPNHGRIGTPSDKITFKESFRISANAEECGNHYRCSENEFSIHLNTGYQNSVYPKLCIDGKYLPDKFFGRGINLVTIDNTTRMITNVQTFDTNSKDSINFETQLLSLRPGDKIILFTFDEVPSKLSKVAKLLINELGSVHIQNLQFRTAWFLISEKEIKGYSPYEEIHLPVPGMQWPPPHNLHTCIPFQIKGDFVKVDQSLFGNRARVEYCKQFKDKWRGFCDDDVVNEPLYTISTTNDLLQSTPILIFSDPDRNDLLSLTLETVFRQPGILPKNVLVFYNQESSNELQNLVKLFLFKSFKIDLARSTTDLGQRFFNQVQNKIKLEFTDAKQFVLIFGNLILTADFLNYFTQLIPLFWYPNSKLSFISAWNDNCYNTMCTDEKLVLRVSGSKFSFKHALAIKNDHQFFNLLESVIQLNRFKDQSVVFHTLNDGLTPDFPRVIVSSDEISDLFLDETNDQKISLFENVKLNQIESLYTVDAYLKSLNEFRENSLQLKDEQNLVHYLDNRQNNTSVNITVFSNSSTFDRICTIFSLKYCSANYINGNEETLRFNFDNHLSVLLIKSSL